MPDKEPNPNSSHNHGEMPEGEKIEIIRLPDPAAELVRQALQNSIETATLKAAMLAADPSADEMELILAERQLAAKRIQMREVLERLGISTTLTSGDEIY